MLSINLLLRFPFGMIRHIKLRMETSLAGVSAPSVPFELSALAEAHRYQRWLYQKVAPFLGARILELGSGIGNLSQHLPRREKLILSDVETAFIQLLEKKFAAPEAPIVSVAKFEIGCPPPASLRNENIDTVVSFNVFEHVPDDSALMGEMIDLLVHSKAPGPKRLVSLVPAHSWAYGPLDKEYGHHRRYSAKSYHSALLRAGANPTQGVFRYRYLNLLGLMGWYTNGVLLRKSEIGGRSIKTFERILPLVRPMDDLLYKTFRLPIGNSLVAVYELP